jgi:hypothetical protein
LSTRRRLENALRHLRAAQTSVKEAIHFEPLSDRERANLEGTLLRLHEDETHVRKDMARAKH